MKTTQEENDVEQKRYEIQVRNGMTGQRVRSHKDKQKAWIRAKELALDTGKTYWVVDTEEDRVVYNITA